MDDRAAASMRLLPGHDAGRGSSCVATPVAAPAAARAAACMAARVAALEQAFRGVAHRMAGPALLNAGLHVQAVGFRAQDGGAWALGVLVTPWFMNLVRLPLDREARAITPGACRTRGLAGRQASFIGAWMESVGAFEACSLFSPMQEFRDQEAAVAVAREVLVLLNGSGPGTTCAMSGQTARMAPSKAPSTATAGAAASLGNAEGGHSGGTGIPGGSSERLSVEYSAAPGAVASPAWSRRGFLAGRAGAARGA